MTWHVSEQDLMEYAERALQAPRLWSAEAHLAACAACRERLDEQLTRAEPDLIEAGWARLDAELDAPRPGALEQALVWSGVGDSTARLLVATPALRRSWLLALTATLALLATTAALAGNGSTAKLAFLVLVPLLPLAGVGLSFGPRVDPLYELTVVAPVHTLRLLLIRAVTVLATTTALTALACLAVPDLGLRALGWVLPALALTLLSLALIPRFGPAGAPIGVGTGWILLALLIPALSRGSTSGSWLLFGAAGQLAVAGVAIAAGYVLLRLRPVFDTVRPAHLDRTSRSGIWRNL